MLEDYKNALSAASVPTVPVWRAASRRILRCWTIFWSM